MELLSAKVNGMSVSSNVSLQLRTSPFTNIRFYAQVVAEKQKLKTSSRRTRICDSGGFLFEDECSTLFRNFRRISTGNDSGRTPPPQNYFDTFWTESAHRFGGRHLTNLCLESFCSLDHTAHAQCDRPATHMRCVSSLAVCFSATPPLPCRRRHGEHRGWKGVWDRGLQQGRQTSVSHMYQARYSRLLFLFPGTSTACPIQRSAVAMH